DGIDHLRSELPTDAALQLLRNFLTRLLAKSEKERYQDASEALAALNAAIGRKDLQEQPEIRESFLQAADFVGREGELKQLKAALGEARKGCGCAWLIGGESGVGKTRLASELRIYALAQGTAAWIGQAVSEGALAFQEWRDPLQRLVLAAEPTDQEAAV